MSSDSPRTQAERARILAQALDIPEKDWAFVERCLSAAREEGRRQALNDIQWELSAMMSRWRTEGATLGVALLRELHAKLGVMKKAK